MDKRTMACNLVADFGKMLTLPSLILDDLTNSCVLVFDGDLLLNIEYDDLGERLVFSVYLEAISGEGSESLLRELLGANLYWHRTRGATLCLEEGTNGIILIYARSVTELDGSSFETLVENFLIQAEKWRARIKAFQPKEESARIPDSVGPFTPMFG